MIRKKIKEEGDRLNREIRERTTSYVIAALSLVAGLAWNDAIKSTIEYAFPISNNTVQAKLIYAVLMTLFIVIITVYLVRFFGEEQKKQ